MKVKNHYTVQGDEIEEGDVFLFVVKAMVGYSRNGKLTYRLYRCPWEGDPDGPLPQGGQVDMAQPVDQALFSTLAAVGVRD